METKIMEGKLMFKEYLLKAINNQTPVSIYTDNEEVEKFSLGFIQGVSDDYVLLASISPFGFYDGFTIKNYKDIYRCESKDKYGEKAHKLYQIRKQNHPSLDLTSDDLILNLIQYAYDSHLVVSIELNHSEYDDLQGFISGIQGDMITIEQRDDYGNADGESIVFWDNITCVTCDSDKEMAIKLLSENQ